MPRWNAGRRWGLVAGALLVLVGAAAALAIYAGLYNIAADVPHPQPVYWLFEKYGTGRSQPGHGISLFQRIWMMRTASQQVRACMRRCAAVVILRPA